MKKLEIGVGQYVAISAATMLTGVVIGAYACKKKQEKQTNDAGMSDKEIDDLNKYIDQIQQKMDEDVQKFNEM